MAQNQYNNSNTHRDEQLEQELMQSKLEIERLMSNSEKLAEQNEQNLMQ